MTKTKQNKIKNKIRIKMKQHIIHDKKMTQTILIQIFRNKLKLDDIQEIKISILSKTTKTTDDTSMILFANLNTDLSNPAALTSRRLTN